MKKIIIAVLIIGVGVGLYVGLSGDSYQFETGASQNVERPNVQANISRYIDPSGFSFEKITGYEIRVLAEEIGKTLLFEKEGKAATGFQMFVSYYDEPALGFTTARIKKDLPDLVMKDVKEFDIAGGRGVSFESGSDREIWFVGGESLYQITAPVAESANAQKVVDTFKI